MDFKDNIQTRQGLWIKLQTFTDLGQGTCEEENMDAKRIIFILFLCFTCCVVLFQPVVKSLFSIYFQSKSAGDKSKACIGLYTYPILQSADILLYK